MQALEAGANAISEICQQIQDWATEIGKAKRTDLVQTDLSFDEEASQSSLAADIKKLYSENLGRSIALNFGRRCLLYAI